MIQFRKSKMRNKVRMSSANVCAQTINFGDVGDAHTLFSDRIQLIFSQFVIFVSFEDIATNAKRRDSGYKRREIKECVFFLLSSIYCRCKLFYSFSFVFDWTRMDSVEERCAVENGSTLMTHWSNFISRILMFCELMRTHCAAWRFSLAPPSAGIIN